MTKPRRKIIPYDPKLKEIARKLRRRCTKSEAMLWRHLKGKQRLGFDFHRQKPIDNYIVDFFCRELKLAIELDGITHDFKIGDDMIRQERLESSGIHFLRFKDADIFDNIQGVILAIDSWIEENT